MTKENAFKRQRELTLKLAQVAPDQMANILHREWLIFGSLMLDGKENPDLQLIMYALDFAKEFYCKPSEIK